MKHAILATALAALSTLTADAALVTFGAAQNITGDTDVSVNGTFVDAMNIAGGTVTVNGVLFTGVPGIGGTTPSLSFTVAGGGTTSGSTSIPPFGSLSADYAALLAAGPQGNITLTLSGLTIGDTYELQFWSNMTAFPNPSGSLTAISGANSVTLDTNVGNVNGGLGQFAFGTFVADSVTQVVSFSSNTTDGVLNGAQLRNITSEPETPTAVPEPGTALAGVMLAGLVGLRRRRK